MLSFNVHEDVPKGLLNQYSPVTHARSSIAEKDATRSASTDLCRLRNQKGNIFKFLRNLKML